MNGEAVLISLVGTEMQESACDFSLSETPEEVLSRVVACKKHSFEVSKATFGNSRRRESPR